ncbi:E3 ubiquitin-protein ligase RBBP6-like isoform X4 [Phyllopteryx taeniolatus]|uniref:E3 ubiquitin-protein ligase RBBP6-like isoform X4 n=1 Tax=Phyllopteryx taeniolatus TaxID=161469 RepID=UPI002AD1D7BB|nr:E3 ubiquitin-protein ligase RBBP6-like isoform X4 [Phyllopteryx taeniolatus]
MSCVHYKFSSKLDYNTVTFDGLHITLSELKRQIMSRERLKATDCDLQITNAQTREEYTDDEAHIPKHSSVIVRRTPIGGVKPAGRTFIVDRSDTSVAGSSRPVCNKNKQKNSKHTQKTTLTPPLTPLPSSFLATCCQLRHVHFMLTVLHVIGCLLGSGRAS